MKRSSDTRIPFAWWKNLCAFREWNGISFAWEVWVTLDMIRKGFIPYTHRFLRWCIIHGNSTIVECGWIVTLDRKYTSSANNIEKNEKKMERKKKIEARFFDSEKFCEDIYMRNCCDQKLNRIEEKCSILIGWLIRVKWTLKDEWRNFFLRNFYFYNTIFQTLLDYYNKILFILFDITIILINT